MRRLQSIGTDAVATTGYGRSAGDNYWEKECLEQGITDAGTTDGMITATLVRMGAGTTAAKADTWEIAETIAGTIAAGTTAARELLGQMMG
jgi:hypothetical protein